ncbi:ABC transporter substrate-binding protein [Deinococcus fonticola]|uniref:ABC transporter substrate-binding protein n=1 Tax=Deinococcus fonticola TaxID=2528713 RepID=UPI0010751E98|nr:ABC transporter substrate-binding protein [Deinococcus fonticola]
MKKLLLLSWLLLGAAQAAAPQDTLVIMQGADIPTLDPGAAYDDSSGSIVENVYERLVGYKGSSIRQFEPMLATKWAISNGNKTYTFDLRKGVKFHSGAPFTCADARYTFQRNLVTNNSNSGNWFLSESLLGTQDNAWKDKTITWARIQKAVECNAAGQLVFNMPKPDGTFLAKLAFYGNGIVERAYSAKIGEWSGTEKDWRDWVGKDLTDSKLSRAPNGTGAYRFLRMDAGSILLEAFPAYWGGKAPIDRVLRRKVTDQAVRIQAFLKGDADFIEGGSRAVDEEQIKGKPGVGWVDDLPNVTAAAILMNNSIKDPRLIGSGKLDGQGIPADFFANINVRKAFSYAYNYPEAINVLLNGKGKQRTMLMPDAFFGYDDSIKMYTYNPAQAAYFFKQAYKGELWNKGFKLVVNYRAGSVGAQTNFELLKKSIEAINPKFKIVLQPKQWSDLISDSKLGKESLFLITWIPDYADPDNFLYTYYASDGFYSSVSNYRDERMDILLQQARQTGNPVERSKWYSQLGKRAYDTAPAINMAAATRFVHFRNNLVGISAENFNPMLTSPGGVLWKDLRKK